MTYDDFKKLWDEASEHASANDPENPQRAMLHHLLTHFDGGAPKAFPVDSGESGEQ